MSNWEQDYEEDYEEDYYDDDEYDDEGESYSQNKKERAAASKVKNVPSKATTAASKNAPNSKSNQQKSTTTKATAAATTTAAKGSTLKVNNSAPAEAESNTSKQPVMVDFKRIKDEQLRGDYELLHELVGGNAKPNSAPSTVLPDGATFESFKPKTEEDLQILATYLGQHIAPNDTHFYYRSFIVSLVKTACAGMIQKDWEEVVNGISAIRNTPAPSINESSSTSSATSAPTTTAATAVPLTNEAKSPAHTKSSRLAIEEDFM